MTDSSATDRPILPIGALIVVAVAAVAAWVITEIVDPKPPEVVEGVSVFAVVIVVAAAIERLLEPLVSYWGLTKKDEASGEVKTARRNIGQASAPGAEDVTALTNAKASLDEAKKKLDQATTNRAIVVWTIATVLALLASGIVGLYMLRLVGVPEPPRGLDILITGLAIGAGTKPLHDLLTSIEKKKETAKAAAEAVEGK
jgi:hypothetical protein